MENTPDIKVPDIEKELELVWKKPQEKKPLKACLFTLIIYAHQSRQVSYLQELVDTILDKFPCRIIFIQWDDQADHSYLHANVSTVASGQDKNHGGSIVACDQISIKASQDQLSKVPFLVIPHIVPDLPVYLLWGHNPFKDKEIFPQLQNYASRIIFDSECSDNLPHFCCEVQNYLPTLKIDAMDVNWALIGNWRDVLFQLFDTPEKLQQLKNAKSIIITYNDLKTETRLHPEIRSLYLQGWLAARLDWKFRQMEPFVENSVISYFSTTTPVVVALVPKTDNTTPTGAILSIEINTPTGESYSIVRRPNTSQLMVHISSKETCALPFTISLPNPHKGLAFMKEIFYNKLGNHYLEMLKMVANIG